MVQNHNTGVPKRGTANRNGATCIACGGAVKLPYVREQGRDRETCKNTLMAIVAEGIPQAVVLLAER